MDVPTGWELHVQMAGAHAMHSQGSKDHREVDETGDGYVVGKVGGGSAWQASSDEGLGQVGAKGYRHSMVEVGGRGEGEAAYALHEEQSVAAMAAADARTMVGELVQAAHGR